MYQNFVIRITRFTFSFDSSWKIEIKKHCLPGTEKENFSRYILRYWQFLVKIDSSKTLKLSQNLTYRREIENLSKTIHDKLVHINKASLTFS